MKKLRYTEEKADSSLAYLWFTAQTEENSMSIITSMISHKLSSMQELQEAIELFMDYVNHCPRWFLKGYSSEEAFVLFQKDKFRKNPPRIVAGPVSYTHLPYHSTIAHGYLTLSMLPYLWNQIIQVNNLKMMINYGMDKMKFGQAVLSGQSIRCLLYTS